MNLTKPTHNLMSNVRINATQNKTPEVGMGVTVCLDRDRHAGTVIQYDPDNEIIIVQQDEAIRTDDGENNEFQTYDYNENLKGRSWVFRRFKNRWEEIQLSARSQRWVRIPKNTTGLIIGERNEFVDFNEQESPPNPTEELSAENSNEVNKAVQKVAAKKK